MSKDILYDILENIHEAQGFGKLIYIDKENLSIVSTYDKIEEPNLVYLGTPVTDEMYDEMLMNYDDSYINITESYLDGEKKELYNSLLKYCENGLIEFKEIFEEQNIDSPEEIIDHSSDLLDFLSDTYDKDKQEKFTNFVEIVEEKEREIKDYIVSDEICESINTFSSYSGRWETLRDYKDFLESNDSLDLRELNKIVSVFAFKQCKDINDFNNIFSESDNLDIEAILEYFSGSDLTKDQLSMLTDIQFYFYEYPNDYDFGKKLIPLLSTEERMILIEDNSYISINSLMDYGFEPNSEEEAIAIVGQNGRLLHEIRHDFSDNDRVVLCAVKENGYALEDASNRLKDNPMVVLEAVLSTKSALNYASSRIKDVCINQMDNLESALESIILSDKLRNDLDKDQKQKQKKVKI